MVFSLEKAPHIVTKRSTFSIMAELSAVLAVVFLYSTIWYGIKAGGNYSVHAVIILLISVLTCVFADALWALPKLWDKNVKDVKTKLLNWWDQILHSYGWVSGLIFALLVPVGTWYYVVFVGAFVGTFLAKSLFGGFGKNIFNPAITARVFVQLCFPTYLTTYLGEKPTDFVISTGASITSTASDLGWTTNMYGLSLGDMFLGNYRGTLGETYAFLIIIALAYLIVREIIDWRIPAFYLATLFLTALFMGFGSGLSAHSFEFALRNILLGGALFGSVFCLTDPVTAPTSRAGKIIYAVGAALLTSLIRYKASAVEGVAYSIMLMNMLSPLIGRELVAKSNKKIGVKVGLISGIAVLSMVFGVVHGVNNKTSDVYKKGIERYDENLPVYGLVVNTAQTSAGSYKKAAVPTFSGDYANITCTEKIDMTMDGAPASYYDLLTDPNGLYASKKYSIINEMLTAQNLTNVDIADLIDYSGTINPEKKLTLDNSTISMKIGNFNINGKSAAFYEVNTKSVNATGDSSKTSKDYMSIELGLLVTEDGIVGAELIKDTNLVYGKDDLTTQLGLITISNPYTSSSSLSFPTTGASGHDGAQFTDEYSEKALQDVLTEFTGDVMDPSKGAKMPYLNFGIIVNSKGTVGYSLLKSNENSVGLIYAQNIKLSISNPYLTGDLTSAQVNTDITETGSTTPVTVLNSKYTVPAILKAMRAAENNFGLDVHETVVPVNDNIANLNALLTAQSLSNVTSADVSDVTSAAGTLSHGKINAKLNGFKVNSKDAAYYDVTSNPVDASGKGGAMSIQLGLLVTSDGVVGASYLNGTDVEMGETNLKKALSEITLANPFTASATLPYIETGASITPGMASFLLKETIAEFASSTGVNVTNLNTILTAQGLANVTKADVVDVTSSAKALGTNNGTINLKLNGFKVNSKDAAYYDVTTTPVYADNEAPGPMSIQIGLLVTSDGIIGATYIKGTEVEMGESQLKASLAAITLSAPFTSSSTVPVTTGATVTPTYAQKAMLAVLSEFGGN
jgi:electron transport complex protein RnfD